MNERIKKFIEKQTCATICCVDGSGKPYCFNIFYAFDAGKVFLYYKSSNDTKHTPLLKANQNIAGTILPDKLKLLMIKGIQFEGSAFIDKDDPNTKSIFYGKHPIARTVSGEIWTIQIDKIKYTDNSLGFGKKLLWERQV